MLQALTLFHVLVSLVGIGSGFVVMAGLLKGNRLEGWTKIFLGTTIATSVTGYFFPVDRVMPSHIVGALSLVALAISVYGWQRFHLAGWRRAYVISAVIALYFNVFVLVVQSFQKVPFLHDLAPTQTEPAFPIAQTFVLVGFIAL
jgi:hypothetical protein